MLEDVPGIRRVVLACGTVDSHYPLLVESLQELVKMEYYCDLFLYGTDGGYKGV